MFFRKALIALALILFSSISCAQTKDSLIKNIRQVYNSINSDKSLKIVKLEDEEEFLGNITDGGGSLTGYFKGNEILKIHIWIGLSYGVSQFEYYFDNGKLFFVYEKEEDFARKGDNASLDYTKLNWAFEGRYYIDQTKGIEQKIIGKRLMDASEFDIKETLKDLMSYKKLLNSHLAIK